MNLYITVFQQPLPLGVLINDFYECEILSSAGWAEEGGEKKFGFQN